MKSTHPTPIQALAVSLVLPGAAHIWMGRKFSGIIHLGSMIVLWAAGLAFKANQPFNFNVEIGVTYLRIAVAMTILIGLNAWDLAKIKSVEKSDA